MPPSDDRLAALRADVCRRVPDPPGLDEVVEDAGRQRLAAYYLYSALLAGVIDDDALAPARWPPELAEPMRRMGLELELIRGWRVVGTCLVKDHWELIAQYLAGAPLAEAQSGEAQPGEAQPGEAQPGEAQPGETRPGEAALDDTPKRTVAGRLKESGIAHAVSLGVTLAVGVHPLGTVAGLGTRLIRDRVRAGHEQADALGRLANELRALRAQTDAELAGRSQ